MTLDAARGLLACPVCAAPLTVDAPGGPLACASGHAFDVAKQGYVNLLGARPPANADTAAMLAARERLLGAGLYDPIADAVAGRLARSATILEVGAGTGEHLVHSRLGRLSDQPGP